MTASILFLSYNPQAPSFRYRSAPAIELLRQRGFDCRIERLPPRRYFKRLYDLRAQLRGAAVVVLEKIQFMPLEALLVRRFAKCIVLTVDDAIYVRKPHEPNGQPHDSRWRRAKFEATCHATELVIAGNQVLAEAARPHARRVEIVPTPIDCDRYRQSVPDPARPPRIVWVGLPENLIYLQMLKPVISRLQERWPQLRLRVVSSRFPDWPDSMLERISWSPQSEVDALTTADVGIMPLTDNTWTRGKCAFKLLQYMAAALPCVASPVGANCDVVLHERNGFLVREEMQWYAALAALLESPELRLRFGTQGLAHARAHYDMPVLSRRTAELIADLAGSATRRSAPVRASAR